MGELVRPRELISTKDDGLEFWRKELRVEDESVKHFLHEGGMKKAPP